MKKLCKICNREVDEDLFEYHYNSEYHLLEKIMERYPAWNSNEGKVIWFYRNFVLNSKEAEILWNREEIERENEDAKK